MEIRFWSSRLQRCFQESSVTIRQWGPVVGQRYVQRINAIKDLDRGEQLHLIRSLDFHPLTGERTGQHAIRLTGQMRLILTVDDERTVSIVEVVDYHD